MLHEDFVIALRYDKSNTNATNTQCWLKKQQLYHKMHTKNYMRDILGIAFYFKKGNA